MPGEGARGASVLLQLHGTRPSTHLSSPAPAVLPGAPKLFRQAWELAGQGLRISHQREIVIGGLWVNLYLVNRR